MKTDYLLASFLLLFKATANPIGGGNVNVVDALRPRLDQRAAGPAPPSTTPASPSPAPLTRAPDPPAEGFLPPQLNGVLLDGSIINYNPSYSKTNFYTCWDPPASRPAPSVPYNPGTCPVCVLQRNNNNGSADYQLWARDNLNNAMGNMQDGTTVYPLDGIGAQETVAENQPNISMGGHNLQLQRWINEEPEYPQTWLIWETPLNDPSNPAMVQFDPSPNSPGGSGCEPYGTASGGAVIYFECIFDC